MFHCYLHNWSHIERQCPLCAPTVITTTSISAMADVFTDPRVAKLEAENKKLKEALRKIRDYETLDGNKYANYEHGWHGVAEFAGEALAESEK